MMKSSAACTAQKVVRIALLVASFSGIATGEAHRTARSNYAGNAEDDGLYSIFMAAVNDLHLCRSLTLCQLIEKFKTSAQSSFPPPDASSEKYSIRREANGQARSYLSGYAAPVAPAYYPAFDPISVLASLAFLAFLLQSFASLFDRSRSIIPSIVSSRQLDELEVPDGTKKVLRALQKYENWNK